jgi:hypothetical protein
MRQPHAWPRGDGDGALDVRKDRGFPKITREDFEHEVEYGSPYVGSPETVGGRIVRTVTTLDADRFDLKYGHGGPLFDAEPARQDLRARPPAQATSGISSHGLGSGRQRVTGTTPGSRSSRPSKKPAISSGLRGVYGIAPLPLL